MRLVLLKLRPCSVAAFGAILAVSTLNAQAPTKRPNILIIALDDVGFSDLGTFGSEIATPNIDAIAKRGLRYTRFDTNAICSPTRASLLTGRNAPAVRMTGLPSALRAPDPADQSAYRGEIPRNAEFLPEALKNVGYSTLAMGKWHLSPQYETGQPGHNASFPLQRGFDYFYGYKLGWTDQYRPELFEGNTQVRTTTQAPNSDDYLLSSDLIDHAIRELTNRRQSDPAKPFFFYLAMPVAHTPTQVHKEYVDKYTEVYSRGWDRIREERFARQKQMGLVAGNAKLTVREKGDPAWDSLTPQQRRVYARFMAAYAGYLQYGDEQIGRLMSYLKTSGLEDNTLIVLLSDNGPASETKTGGFRTPYNDRTTLQQMDDHLEELAGPTTQPLYQRPWAYAGATPLRRYKLWPFLGGIRTPLIVSWPGKVKDEGAIRTQYLHVSDLAPTLLEAAGTSFRTTINGEAQIPVSGRSMLATIGSAKAASPRSVQFFELWGNRAITSGRWRAVSIHKPGNDFAKDLWQLFDIGADPTESTDLSAKMPARLKQMQELWRQEAAKYGDLPQKETPPGRVAEFTDAYSKD